MDMRRFLYNQLFITPPNPTTPYTGQTVIITGSNAGLGKEATRHIVRLGAARVIMAVRNTRAGEEAKRDIEASTRRTNIIEVWELDLSSFDSVKTFAKRALQLPRLDVLLENAGIVAPAFKLEGEFESSVKVNVISTFLLALMVLPKLKQTARENGVLTKITVVTSEMHEAGKLPAAPDGKLFEALSEEKNFDQQTTYANSKLLEVFAVRDLAPRLQGSDVVLNMINPGYCISGLNRHASGIVAVVMALMTVFLGRKTEVGSRTLVAGASAGPKTHGMYMSNCVADDNYISPQALGAQGNKTAEKVWTELAGVLENIEPGVTSVLSN